MCPLRYVSGVRGLALGTSSNGRHPGAVRKCPGMSALIAFLVRRTMGVEYVFVGGVDSHSNLKKEYSALGLVRVLFWNC